MTTPASIKTISSSSMAASDRALINGREEVALAALDVFLFVKNTLVDGHPSINAGTYTSYGLSDTYADESLAYLFNNDKQNGKAVYNNVKGLFQLKDGYYVYDSYGSDGNYAVYSPATNLL